MPWQLEPQPEWVRAVNDGSIYPIARTAALPFEPGLLLGEARARLGRADGGLGDFGDDDFAEPFRLVLRALEDEADLTVFGRWFARGFVTRLLEVRLQLTDLVAADPGVRAERIAAPIVVTGAPRTGTTLLYGLLACDPRHRVPEGWELLRPVPPPDPATFAADPRIPLADVELQLPQIVAAGLSAIHEYGGRMPKECLSAMSFAFRSEEFVSRYRVPSYVDWLQRCDMRPAYEMHRLVLQVLQRRFTDVQWVLKSPVHLHSLPVLLDVYPDARVVVTHRDPLTVLASVTSLLATLRSAQSDRVDVEELGRYHVDLYARSLDHLVSLDEGGSLPPDRVRHIAYADLVADAGAVTRDLYRHFGLPGPAPEARGPDAGGSGRPEHHYSFADLGLDPVDTRRRFARYQAHFAVPDEELG
jgi:hypothetical protein